jgi:glucokinase
MQTVYVGIDIGGTNVVWGLVAANQQLCYQTSFPIAQTPSPQSLVQRLSAEIKAQCQGQYALMGIGIGAPNGNFHRGTVEFAPNLHWPDRVPLVAMFQAHFPQIPIVLTNDANAAALGEQRFGGAKGLQDFIFITLGTGVGSGLVANGQLIYGHDGFAGEVGHVILYPQGRLCGCGRQGCVEAYCSAGGLRKTYQDLGGEPSLLAADIAQRAQAGEPLALQAFDYTANCLGLALANSVAYTSPQAIFLFGGLAKAGAVLFEPLRQYFEQYLLSIYRQKIAILPSQLPQGEAALLGAASLVFP